MALTPLIMIAGDGILTDTAFTKNTDLVSNISSYSNNITVSAFNNTVADLLADLHSDDGGSNSNGIHLSVINTFRATLDNSAPYLFDRIPSAYTVLTVDTFTAFLNNHLDNLLATSGQYAIYLQIANGYVQTTNEYLNSAANGADLGAQTFTSMDSLVTGNITSVNKFTSSWGQDLLNTGNLFDFSRLDIIGTPQALLESLIRVNGLTLISAELEENGLDPISLQTAINDSPDLVMNLLAQKRCYDAFQDISGQQLDDILSILEIKTSDITSLTDLLDLKKLFPNSYLNITSLNDGNLETIFDVDGNPSTYVQNLETEFSVVMPEDIARVNAAFGISLQQIKNIHQSTPQILGEQALSLETNQGLSIIDSLSEALPASVISSYQTLFTGGNGPNGTFYVSDLVGSPAGVPHTDNIETVNDVISDLDNLSALDDILEILTVASGVANGDYDGLNPGEVSIGPDLPGTGYYLTKDDAITALSDELSLAYASLSTEYSAETSSAESAYDDSVGHIFLELEHLSLAGIEFTTTYTTYDSGSLDGLPASKQSILSFTSNLHVFGKLSSKGNVAELLEKVSDTSTQGGQAIIAAMREGRNLDKLNTANIKADNEIDSTPAIIEPGDIQSSTQ